MAALPPCSGLFRLVQTRPGSVFFLVFWADLQSARELWCLERQSLELRVPAVPPSSGPFRLAQTRPGSLSLGFRRHFRSVQTRLGFFFGGISVGIWRLGGVLAVPGSYNSITGHGMRRDGRSPVGGSRTRSSCRILVLDTPQHSALTHTRRRSGQAGR